MDSIPMFWDVRNEEKHATASVEMTDVTVASLTGGSGGGYVPLIETQFSDRSPTSASFCLWSNYSL